MFDRPLPAFPMAEAATLSILMQNLKLLPYCVCSGKDFVDIANELIFETLVEMRAVGLDKADIALLAIKLKRKDAFTQAGGEVNLDRIRWTAPNVTVLHIKAYSKEVREAAIKREIITTCLRTAESMFDERANPQECAEQLRSDLIHCTINELHDYKRIRRCMDSFTDGQEEASRAGKSAAYLCGLPCLDYLGFSFVPGELSVLAAKPSVGKTALAAQAAEYQALQDRPSMLISLEMSEREIGQRHVLPRAGLSGHTLRSRSPQPDEVDRMRKACERCGDPPFFVWEPSRATVSEIESVMTIAVERDAVKIFFVDYLQLIHIPFEKHITRADQVGNACKTFKQLAKKLKVPVVLLSQLNRKDDLDEFSRPNRNNLRDSGAIEQDTDNLFFMWKEPMKSGQRSQENIPAWSVPVQFASDKIRQGEVGNVRLYFHGESTRFYDPRDADEPTPDPQKTLGF